MSNNFPRKVLTEKIPKKLTQTPCFSIRYNFHHDFQRPKLPEKKQVEKNSRLVDVQIPLLYSKLVFNLIIAPNWAIQLLRCFRYYGASYTCASKRGITMGFCQLFSNPFTSCIGAYALMLPKFCSCALNFLPELVQVTYFSEHLLKLNTRQLNCCSRSYFLHLFIYL